MKTSRVLINPRAGLNSADAGHSDNGPVLLPWADPYIASLERANAAELRAEEKGDRDPAKLSRGFNCHVRHAYPAPKAVAEFRRQEKMTRLRTQAARAW